MRLGHTHCDVRQGVGAQVMRVADFCYAMLSWHSKNVKVASHIILHMMHLTTKSYSLPSKETI